MKKCTGRVLSMFLLLSLVVTPASATKPGEEVNPNGFPSGEHHNLNIIGKKADFTCPEQEYDELGNPIYGNVIFVPENGQGIEIFMQSGKGKKAADIPTLQVIDPCSVFDGNEAVLQLPKHEAGYDVYARALAKPTDNPEMTVTPGLFEVLDEDGYDLIYLGLVTSNGFETPFETFIRKKGKSKAVEITGLFEWTGEVCYFTDGYCDPGGCDSITDLCCTDADMDGIYEGCVPKELDVDCPEGTVQVTAFCNSYTAEWVFNIGDFVTYLWDIQNNGLKLLQVRFYPR
jgi:hypothetical protein